MKSNLANKRTKAKIDSMNNMVLVLSGIIFCINVITNVFIQVDFGDILATTTNGIRPTEPGTGDFLFK